MLGGYLGSVGRFIGDQIKDHRDERAHQATVMALNVRNDACHLSRRR